MPQEDFEDLNVANLSETKLQRAPGFEARPKAPCLKAAAVTALIVTAALVSVRALKP